MQEETHIIKRAIIMAAGIGKRMQPLTLRTPKPLVRVNGKRMIDTVIEGLHLNGITEIYIVVGHLKEQFYPLSEEYPGVVIVENPYYNSCNNISSLYVAREFLHECFILDGDQIIYNPAVLNPVFCSSGYNSVWCEEDTDEWLLKVENNKIKRCFRTGGSQGWQLYSISRWSESDGKRLKHHLEIEFNRKKNRQIYWDDVALFCYPDEYELSIYKMNKEDVVEIDSLKELAEIDSTYLDYYNNINYVRGSANESCQ